MRRTEVTEIKEQYLSRKINSARASRLLLELKYITFEDMLDFMREWNRVLDSQTAAAAHHN